MRISWIKTKKDNESFRIFENLGFDVYSLDEPEETDKKIDELINNNCKTIILSNEIASFSEDIIRRSLKVTYPLGSKIYGACSNCTSKPSINTNSQTRLILPGTSTATLYFPSSVMTLPRFI